MHCEGAKVYDKAGDCPVCGMDLVKAPDLVSTKAMYTCPMHPEIIQEGPGSCPICGMDLVPMKPTESEDNKTYLDLLRKMKIASILHCLFYHCHVRYDSNNPLMQVMDSLQWNWVQFALSLPVVFMQLGCFLLSHLY
jgi:Cu2+-exporting ATPase